MANPADTVHSQLPRLDRHKPKCGPVRPSRTGRWRAAVLVAVHVAIALHVWHFHVRGTTISPLEPSESMQTLEQGLVNAGFLLFSGSVLATLLLGRWFCGWACHVVALQDACAWLLARLGLKPKPVRSRLLVGIPFGVAFYMFLWPTLKRWWEGAPGPELQWELHTSDFWRTFPGPWMAVATFVVVGFLVVWWLGAKGFCTYGCPYGGVFAVADRFAPGRIRVTDACDGCGHCTQVCTSNVRVHEEVAVHRMVVDPACMKCLDCVSTCPKEALHFGFGAVKPAVLSQQRIAARADFSWGEELVLAALFLAGLFAWRGTWLTEPVPLLMAVGLGAITAVMGLMAFRLLRQREFTFQHARLRVEGQFTRSGWAALLLTVAWFAFTAWAGSANLSSARAGEAGARVMLEQRTRQQERREPLPRADVLAAADAVARALQVNFDSDPALLQLEGLLRREAGDHAAAERLLQQAVDGVRHPGDLPRALVALAIYQRDRGNLEQAAAMARLVLERSPDNQSARVLLQQLEQALRR